MSASTVDGHEVGTPDAAAAAAAMRRVEANLAGIVHAPADVLRRCVLALVAEGHVILEDAPGVGKTMLAKALARSIDCRFARLQFTPDLLPTDVTGASVYDQRANQFAFRPGPVFANLLLVDEINRASPKTQAALLECMQERQVTVDGETHRLEAPFMVVATQNPLEFEGTYPLPEAQLDRFAMRLRLGYPPIEEEARMLSEQAGSDPLEALRPVATVPDVLGAVAAARDLHVDPDMNRYVVRVLQRTRDDERLLLGGSPRAGIAVMRVAKARALLEGRAYVSPEDVRDVAPSVLAHRLILGAEARAAGLDGETIVREALAAVAVPA